MNATLTQINRGIWLDRKCVMEDYGKASRILFAINATCHLHRPTMQLKFLIERYYNDRVKWCQHYMENYGVIRVSQPVSRSHIVFDMWMSDHFWLLWLCRKLMSWCFNDGSLVLCYEHTCNQPWRLPELVIWTHGTFSCCSAVWWRKTRIWRVCSFPVIGQHRTSFGLRI